MTTNQSLDAPTGEDMANMAMLAAGSKREMHELEKAARNLVKRWVKLTDQQTALPCLAAHLWMMSLSTLDGAPNEDFKVKWLAQHMAVMGLVQELRTKHPGMPLCAAQDRAIRQIMFGGDAA